MSNRGEWGSRVGFILAAVGSAVGLGNIWRFPYTVASNGGGAFLLPYFIALITAGIPLLILEFGLGHKMRTSAPGVFAKLNKKWEVVGWWQTAIAFAITVYYVVIVAWAVSYVFHGWNLSWGADAKAFFFGDYLGLTDSPLEFGGLQMNVVIPLLFIWVINTFVSLSGVKNGIEKANKVFMPLLIVSILIITIRGLSLPGALDGLNYLFTPDFSKIFDGRVWVAAYGQIFYSLSICFGIMFAYSSYLPKKSDIVNNAFITALGNSSFSILSGIAVFSILGYMAQAQGVGVKEVADGGIGLAFIVFPKAISALPSGNGLFGTLFFISLVFAGLSSTISIIEATVSAVADKFAIGRKKALIICNSAGLLISLIFTSGAGLYILDIVDHYVNNYGVAVAGLIEAILIGWFFNLESVRSYVNPLSDFTIGKWWNVCIMIITPIILGVMTILNIIQDIQNPYEGYPVAAQFLVGVIPIVLTVILALIFTKIKGSKDFYTVRKGR